jgi:hypothetical protein
LDKASWHIEKYFIGGFYIKNKSNGKYLEKDQKKLVLRSKGLSASKSFLI